jgi:hypothetical protein
VRAEQRERMQMYMQDEMWFRSEFTEISYNIELDQRL